MDLVGLQTQVKGRIHAIFHRHGIFHDCSDLFGGAGRKFIAGLCAGQEPQNRHLSPGALQALRDNMTTLLHLRLLLV
jgi:hypothetical protein